MMGASLNDCKKMGAELGMRFLKQRAAKLEPVIVVNKLWCSFHLFFSDVSSTCASGLLQGNICELFYQYQTTMSSCDVHPQQRKKTTHKGCEVSVINKLRGESHT